MSNDGAAGRGRTSVFAAAAVLAALALAGCDNNQKPETKAPVVNIDAILDPTKGTGPWFICDALNAPTVLRASRPNAAGEVSIMTVDKAAHHPPSSKVYALGAPETTQGATTRSLSADGKVIGYVKVLAAPALPDPTAVTTPPVAEVKIDEATLSCRWLASTRLVGITTRAVVVVTQEQDGPVFRTFNYEDADKAQAVQPDAAQRSTTPTLEVRAGQARPDDFAFVSNAFKYSVGEGGITTMENGRVTSGEPFIDAQLAQPATPAS